MKGWLTSVLNAATANKDDKSKASKVAVRHERNTEGSQIYHNDPLLQHLLRNVRSKFVRKNFFEVPVEEYLEFQDVHVLAGTYNVNGKKPSNELCIRDWLSTWDSRWPGRPSGGCDVLTIGFQEIVPLNAGNVIVGVATDGVYAWDRAVAIALNGEAWAAKHYPSKVSTPSPTPESQPAHPTPPAHPSEPLPPAPPTKVGPSPLKQGLLQSAPQHTRGSQDRGSVEGSRPLYRQVAGKQMVGLYLSVWVKESLVEQRCVSGIQATSVATGFGGYLGNKGAVAIRMRVHDTPLCLLCAHLSSGSNEGDEVKRNFDYNEIIRRMNFPAQTEVADAGTLLSAALEPGHWGDARGLLEQENIIWVGDLNYRLKMKDEEVRQHLKSNRLAPLLEADQLRCEMEEGRAFKGWREGIITFPPTFKYRLGSNQYLGDEPHLASPSAHPLGGLAGEASDSEVGSVRSESPGPGA